MKPLDEIRNDIIAQWSGFAIRTEVIKKALNKNDEFQIDVEIHALKEEAKDTDMESGVSADESEVPQNKKPKPKKRTLFKKLFCTY